MNTSAWLADFAQIKEAMSRHYANLDWAVERRGLHLPTLASQTEDALRAATSAAAARSAIEAFLNAFGDGHLEVRWPSPTTGSVDSGERSQSLCSRLGYRRAQRGGGVRFERLPGFEWMPSADSVYFRAGILRQGRDVLGVIRIASFEDNIYPELCEASVEALNLGAGATCDSACEELIGRATADRLTAILSRRIAALREQRITRLLVDLTGNGGGSNWVEPAARMLTRRPLQGARVGFIRHAHYVRTFEAEIARLLTDSASASVATQRTLGRALPALRAQRDSASRTCDRTSYWEGRTPDCSLVVREPPRFSTGAVPYGSPGPTGLHDCCSLFYPTRYRYTEGLYRGPLLVLVDGGTASAAEYFAALIQDNKAGQVLGAPTFGAGCGYTNGGIPTLLRHSAGRVLMPDCVRFRANGLNEVEGIVPDVLIAWRRNDSSLQRARRVAEAVQHAR